MDVLVYVVVVVVLVLAELVEVDVEELVVEEECVDVDDEVVVLDDVVVLVADVVDVLRRKEAMAVSEVSRNSIKPMDTRARELNKVHKQQGCFLLARPIKYGHNGSTGLQSRTMLHNSNSNSNSTLCKGCYWQRAQALRTTPRTQSGLSTRLSLACALSRSLSLQQFSTNRLQQTAHNKLLTTHAARMTPFLAVLA